MAEYYESTTQMLAERRAEEKRFESCGWCNLKREMRMRRLRTAQAYLRKRKAL